jgi:hypothetical protein
MTVHVTAPMLAAFNHFIGVGFIENGAGAAVGNFCQESGEFLIATMFRAHPDASGGVPDALKSGGIAEWLGDRKTAYIAFSGRAETRLGLAKGSLLNDLGTQCDFVVYELQTTPEYATLYQQLTSGSRSIPNLTANFMAVYERPKLGPTANLDNRIEHAEAVVARARLLKAPPSPQPAPPAPAPKVPEPQAPPATPPAPAPSPKSPTIPATIAGLDAAILDQFAAIRDALMAQRDAINIRIAKIEAQAKEFGELEGIFTPPPIPQISAANPAVNATQGSSIMFGPNWQTTLAGIVAALAGAAKVIPALQPYADILTSVGLVAAGIVGVAAKDKNVTGGTISNVTGAVGKPVSLVDRQ